MAQPVRFNSSFGGLDPATIYAVDDRNKRLRPIASGEAYTGAGYQFGQEQVADPNAYKDYMLGGAISRADELTRLKEELNQYQNEQFSQSTQPAQRKASTIDEQITQANQTNSDALTEFESLRKQLQSLQAPNLAQEYTSLRQEAGIPALEGQFTDVRQQRRELPYVERARSGNAGVMTEGQLGARTEQADIPLYIQEGNLIDRLKLAENFVANAMKFKESDFQYSREAISSAASLIGQTVQMARGQLQDLLAQQQLQKETIRDARTFALENKIEQPFFMIGQTVYRTSDGKAYSTPEQAATDGVDVQKWSNVQKVSAPQGEIQYTEIGYDENGNKLYGFVDAQNKTVTPANGSDASFTPNGAYVEGIGNVTAFGSSAWKWGLDVDVTKGQNLITPVAGQVVFAGTNGGFGNQVKIRDASGNEVWLSHLDSINVKVGQTVTTGQAVGTGGNTGTVIPMGGGDGSHVDITVKTPNGYMSPQEVLSYIGGNVSGGESATAITRAMSSLSPQLTEGSRKAFTTNINQLLKSGEYQQAASDIITMAINSVPAGTQEKLAGKFTAINQLNEIEGLLKQFEAKGGKTDLLSGTFEQISQRIGQTSNPDLAYIWNRIRSSIVAYRSAVSGAAFTESEKAEYDALFPNIGVSRNVNTARIRGLRDAFNTDIRSNLQTKLGATNYDNLIKVATNAGDKYDNLIKEVMNLSPDDQYTSKLFSSPSSTPTAPKKYDGQKVDSFKSNIG